MEYKIMDNLIIDEVERVNENFINCKGFMPDWEAMKEFWIKDTDKKLFYFDSFLKKRQPEDKENLYVWIDTGYTIGQEAIFISLVNREEEYVGHYVGTGRFLMNKICNFNPYHIRRIRDNYQIFCSKYKKAVKKREDKSGLEYEEEVESQKVIIGKSVETANTKDDMDEEFPKQHTEITEEIYGAMLYSHWKNIDGLDTYLKVVGRRIAQLIEQDKTEYYVLNNIKSAIVNIGIMDQFGADYLVLYRYYVNKPYYVAAKVIRSKTDFLDEGFTREQSGKVLKPISFWDEGQIQYLPATINDLDVNKKCLTHVVERSIERLPEAFEGLAIDRITLVLMNAIELGFRFQEKDQHCAKAIYSKGRISWLLPFRVNASDSEDPELVIVISKCSEFYEVKTILPYDDAIKDKITAMSLHHQW